MSALIFSFPFQMFIHFNTPRHVFKSLSNENRGRDIGKDAASLLCSQPSWDLNQHGSAALPSWIQKMISLLFCLIGLVTCVEIQNKNPEAWKEKFFFLCIYSLKWVTGSFFCECKCTTAPKNSKSAAGAQFDLTSDSFSWLLGSSSFYGSDSE